MRVQITKTLSRYDLCSNDKEWQVVVRVLGPGKVLSVLFPEDREPDVEDRPPSEVVEIIAEEHKRYLYRGNAAQEAETLAWMREHAEALDHAWAAGMARELTASAMAALEQAAELLKRYPPVAPQESVTA